MKKILVLVIILIAVQNVKAQSVIEDFESWNPYMVNFIQLTEPVDWSGSDSFIVGVGPLFNPSGTFQAQIFQDNPGHTDTGALRVVSKFQSAINAGIANLPAKDYPGICTNSIIAIDVANSSYTQFGGTTITMRPATTSMYIKNNIVGGDTTHINVLLIDDGDGGDSIIAVADTMLTGNVTNYTQITLPFVYNGSTLDPTLVRYTISSGNPLALLDSTNTFSVHDGTSITVDDINVNFTTGIRQHISQSPIAKVYPTVGSDYLNIDFLKEIKDMSLDIYTLNGQLVKSELLKGSSNQIFISNLPSASYIYSIKSKGVIYQTGKLVR